jgi:hypothetical protein
MNKAYLLVLCIFWVSCSHVEIRNEKELARNKFLNFISAQPGEVFSENINEHVRSSLNDYNNHERIDSDKPMVYGDSVRKYSLEGKTAEQIHLDLSALDCEMKENVIREPINNKPILYNNHTIPLVVYLCADGGVVRLKPLGDPTNKLRPEPHASKALRYPYNSKYENYSDETVKVDNFGNAIPKSRADLKSKDFIEGWFEDGHTGLKNLKKF